MDWSASMWKDGLPPLAVQKINQLEDQVERLQKTNQQKQLQFDQLEQTLNKHKQKAEEGRSQETKLSRELQVLEECHCELKEKHQKLQQELQAKENLLKDKQQSSKLPTHDNNETNVTRSASDEANVANLKATIEKLQAENQELKRSKSRSPVKCNSTSYDITDKITTPARGRMAQGDNEMERVKTAKEIAEEKVNQLEMKLRQVTKELECQRHNSEAAKATLEQKFKNKELEFKAEIKEQTQYVAGIEKELNDCKNKLQQSQSQAKTIDTLKSQLEKETRSQQDKTDEIKRLETCVCDLEKGKQAVENQLGELRKSAQNGDKTNDALSSRLELCEAKNKELANSVRMLESNVSGKDTELGKMAEALAEKEKAVINTKQQSDIMEQRCKSLEDDLKVKVASLEKQVQDSNVHIAELQVESDQAKSLQQQLQTLKEKTCNAELHLAEKQETVDKLVKAYEAAKASLETNEKLLFETKQQLTDESDKLQKKDAEIKQQQTELERTNRLLLDQQILVKQLEGKACDATAKYQDNKSSTKFLEEELKHRDCALERVNKDLDETTRNLVSQVCDSKKQLEDERSKISGIRDELAVVTNELLDAKQETERKDIALKQLQAENAHLNELKSQFESSRCQLDELVASVEMHKLANNEKDDQLREFREKLNSKIGKNEELENKVFELSELNCDMDLKIDSAITELKVMKDELVKAMTKIESQNENLRRLEEENSKVEKLQGQLEHKIEALESTQIELSSVRESLEKEKTDNLQMKDDLSAIQNKLQEIAGHDIEELRKKNADLQSQNSALQNLLRDEKASSASLQSKVDEFGKLRSQYDRLSVKLRSDINELEQIGSELESTVSNLRQALDEREAECAMEKVNVQSLQMEVQTMKDMEDELSAMSQEWKRRSEELIKVNEELRTEVEIVRQGAAKFCDEVEVLNKEFSDIQTETRARETIMEFEITDLKDKCEKLVTEKEEVEEKLAEECKQSLELKNHVEQLQKDSKSDDSLKELQHLKDSLEQKSEIIQQLNATIEEIENNLEDTFCEKNKLQQRIDTLLQEKSDFENSAHSDCKNQLSEANERIKYLEAENVEFRSDSDSHSQCEKNILELKGRISSLEKENEEIASDLSQQLDRELHFEEEEAKIQKLENKIEELTLQLENERQRSLENLKPEAVSVSENSVFQFETIVKEKENERLKTAVLNLERDATEIKSAHEELVKNLQDELSNVNRINASLKNEIEQLVDAKNSVENLLDTISSLEEQKADMQMLIEDFESKTTFDKDTIEALQQQKADMQTLIEDLKSRTTSDKETIEKLQQDVCDVTRNLEASLSKHAISLQEVIKEKENLESKYNAKCCEYLKIESRFAEVELTMLEEARLMDKVQELESVESATKEVISNFESEVGALEAELVEVNYQKGIVTHELSLAHEKVESLESQLKNTDAEVESGLTRLAELSQTLDDELSGKEGVMQSLIDRLMTNENRIMVLNNKLRRISNARSASILEHQEKVEALTAKVEELTKDKLETQGKILLSNNTLKRSERHRLHLENQNRKMVKMMEDGRWKMLEVQKSDRTPNAKESAAVKSAPKEGTSRPKVVEKPGQPSTTESTRMRLRSRPNEYERTPTDRSARQQSTTNRLGSSRTTPEIRNDNKENSETEDGPKRQRTVSKKRQSSESDSSTSKKHKTYDPQSKNTSNNDKNILQSSNENKTTTQIPGSSTACADGGDAVRINDCPTQ